MHLHAQQMAMNIQLTVGNDQPAHYFYSEDALTYRKNGQQENENKDRRQEFQLRHYFYSNDALTYLKNDQQENENKKVMTAVNTLFLQ